MNENRLGPVLAFLIGAVVFGGLGFIFGSSRADGRDERRLEVRHEDGDETEELKLPTRPRRWEAEGGERPVVDSSLSEADRSWMLAALAKEKARRKAAEFQPEDTGVAVLRKILEHEADPTPLFESFETFTRPLRRSPGDEETIVVTPENVNEVFNGFAGKGRSRVIFEFTSGEFEIGSALRLQGLEFVTLRGAGVDLTRIVSRDPLVRSHGVDNLRIADMAFDTRRRGDGVLDNREVGAMLLERVRVRGFDCGAGGSSAIYLGGAAYVAVDDCEFLGGSGRSTYSGHALCIRDRCFVFARNCRFQELSATIYADGLGAGAGRVCLEGCRSRFDRQPARLAGELTLELRATRFEDCLQEPRIVGKTVDRGGNVFRRLPEGSFPALENVLARFGSGLVSFSAVDRHVRGEAIYFETRDADGRTQRWFNHPENGPELRLGDPQRATNSSMPPVSAAEALRLALAGKVQDQTWGNGVNALELTREMLDQAEVQVWKVSIGHGPAVRVRADTGVVLPDPN